MPTEKPKMHKVEEVCCDALREYIKENYKVVVTKCPFCNEDVNKAFELVPDEDSVCIRIKER
jgi:hypothetical protein